MTESNGFLQEINENPSRWSSYWNKYPTCVPCRGVSDGPLSANGDLGMVIGGDYGALGIYLYYNYYFAI